MARVCVEIELLKPRPHRIWIGFGDYGFWQSIEYKVFPHYYSICCKLGHQEDKGLINYVSRFKKDPIKGKEILTYEEVKVSNKVSFTNSK